MRFFEAKLRFFEVKLRVFEGGFFCLYLINIDKITTMVVYIIISTTNFSEEKGKKKIKYIYIYR